MSKKPNKKDWAKTRDLAGGDRKPLGVNGQSNAIYRGLSFCDQATNMPAERFDVDTCKYVCRNEVHLLVYAPSIAAIDELRSLIIDQEKKHGSLRRELTVELTPAGSPYLKLSDDSASRAIMTAIGFGEPVNEEAISHRKPGTSGNRSGGVSRR